MRELAIQSEVTNSDADRSFYKMKLINYLLELDRIAQPQYNGINVLDGSYANKVFQIDQCWANNEHFNRQYVQIF